MNTTTSPPQTVLQSYAPVSKCFHQYKHVFEQENEKNTAFHFLSQYLRPPLHHPSCCAPAPLTWSSSSTPTPSWEMAPLSGRRLSTAPASLRGQRCTESTWSPISCGTWIQTRSTTSVCCWLDLEREEPAHLGRLLWAGPSVQVSFDVLTHCTTRQGVVACGDAVVPNLFILWPLKMKHCCDWNGLIVHMICDQFD